MYRSTSLLLILYQAFYTCDLFASTKHDQNIARQELILG